MHPQQPTGAPSPISRTRRVIDIDSVDDIAGYITVNGRDVAVHHLDAIAYRALAALQSDPAALALSTLYDVVERACPELSREEIDRLSGPKIGVILAVAQQGIKEVESQVPDAKNGDRATETATAAPSPSFPLTLLDTSSSESPSRPTATSSP